MILLLGDYSSVHYELSEALKIDGRNVILMSDGDEYKKIKCDIKLPSMKMSKNNFLNKILTCIRFTGFFGVENYLIARREIEALGKIDVAQIINPVVIPSLGAIGNLMLIRFLRKKVRILSLCALGDDYSWVDSCLRRKYKYSALDRLQSAGVKKIINYMYSLKYVYSPMYRFLDFYARCKVDIIVPGLLDYKMAYQNNAKMVNIINIPVASHNFIKPEPVKYPVKIFHAWQKGKENKKGNDLLDEIVQKYIVEHGGDKIQYEIISGIPYNDYLERYRKCDIVMDQIYSYDYGVTGALGMAAGKVVFSGYESGNFDIGINATPDKDQLYKDFCQIINSLELIWKIKNNAYDFAMKKHEAKNVAGEYLKIWGLK